MSSLAESSSIEKKLIWEAHFWHFPNLSVLSLCCEPDSVSWFLSGLVIVLIWGFHFPFTPSQLDWDVETLALWPRVNCFPVKNHICWALPWLWAIIPLTGPFTAAGWKVKEVLTPHNTRGTSPPEHKQILLGLMVTSSPKRLMSASPVTILNSHAHSTLNTEACLPHPLSQTHYFSGTYGPNGQIPLILSLLCTGLSISLFCVNPVSCSLLKRRVVLSCNGDRR